MFELAIVLVLVALNGVFALSELAVVSSRRVRLQRMAEAGRAGAKAALELSDNPGRFLSTVQIGITLIGLLAGAVSGAALGDRLTEVLEASGVPSWLAEPLGYTLVLAFITYLSVVIGELVPKQLALRAPEALACAVAPAMLLLSKVGAPAVWLFNMSTRLVMRLLGRTAENESSVTEEEIRTLVAEAETAGVIESGERDMIAGVLRLGDRAVRGLMTPRTDVDWIDVSDSENEVRAALIDTPHSRLPVADGDPDNIIGVVQARELLGAILSGGPLDLRAHVRETPVLPDTVNALDALGVLRDSSVPMALIHDEYGHFEGIVTPADVLEAIAGAFRSDAFEEEPDAVQRDDGSWLLAGSMPAEEMAEALGVKLPPRRDYHTVAGLLIASMHRLPLTGETVEAFGWRFEVVDLDGRRIDKVMASRLLDATGRRRVRPAA